MEPVINPLVFYLIDGASTLKWGALFFGIVIGFILLGCGQITMDAGGRKVKGIVITTKNEMRVQEFSEPAHRSIGDAVGGWIEIVHPMRLEQTYCMIVNEEGMLRNLPINVFGSFLYGTDTHG